MENTATEETNGEEAKTMNVQGDEASTEPEVKDAPEKQIVEDDEDDDKSVEDFRGFPTPPACDNLSEESLSDPCKTTEKILGLIGDSDISIPPKQTLGKGKRARIPNKRYNDIVISPSRPSRSRSSLENGDNKSGEDNEVHSLAPSPKKAKLVVDINDPKYRKPFEMGWRRELVYRGSTDNPNKPVGDIYYYTPSGKKIRSMRELNENLKNSGLTIENFTFFKEPVGMNDPEKEIIRDAKVWPKKAKSGAKTPNVQSPKLPTKKGAKMEVESKVATRSLGNIKVKLPPSKTKTGNKGKSTVEEEVVNTPTTRRLASKRNAKTTSNVDMEGKPCQPCSIRCQGVMGMVPTLQCRVCLCLYHYECVGLPSHIQIPVYICKNCQLENGSNVSTSAPIDLPPLTPINTLKSLTTQSTILPKLQRIPRAGDSPQQDLTPGGGGMSSSMPRLHPLPKVGKDAPSPSKLSRSNSQTSLVGSVTTWLPHSSTIQVNNNNAQRNKENEPIQTPRPQYIEYLGGRKFLIIPKHNVVSVSPTSAPTKPQKQLNLLDNGGGVKNEPSSPPDNENGEVVTSSTQETVADEEQSELAASAEIAKNVEPKLDSSYQNFCYIHNTFLHVFQYLKVQDLLRASCVCSTWRDIASHPSLWRTVRMKNSQVQSFEGLARSLQKYGTIHLDLRKMLLPTNGGDEIWLEFSKAIKKVQTLRKIEFCRCPASVVEQLGETNHNLEVINAVTIKSGQLDLNVLAALKNLKELRLKSPSVLTLASDITSLKEMTNLVHLSLTAIRELNKMDLGVIASLKNLESLELGECSNFPDNFGNEVLIKLTKLEKLRLEKGQENCHTFEILDAVKQMTHLEQLELVNFDIKSGFETSLGACRNIKKLLIIPTYISQSATTNHVVLRGVLRLKSTLSHFVWGVTLELLRVTELFVDQFEDAEKKKKNRKKGANEDSIPVLKPIPILEDKDEDVSPTGEQPQVEIIPIPNLQKLLLKSLPSTRVKILKLPFHATWRQSITDSVN